MIYFKVPDIQYLAQGYSEYIETSKGLSDGTKNQYISIIKHYLRNQVLNKVEKKNYEDIFNPQRILEFHAYRKSDIKRAALASLLEYLKTEYSEIDRRFTIEYPAIEKPDRHTTEFLPLEAIQFIFGPNVQYEGEEKIIAPCVYALSFFCRFEQKHLISLKVSDLIIEERLIRNLRRNTKNPHLIQWLEVNEKTYNLLARYMEYRDTLNTESDSLLIIDGEPANTATLNKMFQLLTQRNHNKSQINNNVSAQLLVRTFILYSLISTKGKGLAQILQTQEWNSQIREALNKFLEENLRQYNKEDILSQLSYEEIVGAVSNSELYFDSVEPNENKIIIEDVVENIADITRYIAGIPYLEENDVSMEDVYDYENITNRNLVENKVVIQRMVRDSTMAQWLKTQYDNTCQLCDYKLRYAEGNYSEAHHIRPYNKTHRGDDNIRNMIVLCPNCHTQFDDLYYCINPDTLNIHCLFEDDDYHLENLKFKEWHNLGKEYLNYSWELFTQKKNQLQRPQ